ncbi:cobalamin-binding protein [Leeia aquatica]|uniref:Cobalamin-binding protein n=1 Tax=Leeia aquatica TaxID=2725557 RepID=A0A847S5X0_9NEIS|nr:cobalamin-binding protein [Leeia aquatica]NLR75264.1 cobalamin-binding protein [Leeia aquatica]
MKAWLLGLWVSPVMALSVQDDAGRTVTLPHVPQRIISLAPHATELLFEVGAGAQVVGVSAWSDYPAAARSKVQIGGIDALDIERIQALKPDLVVAWQSGNRASDVSQLQRLGLPVYYSEIQRVDAMPDALRRLGRLTGHDQTGAQKARQVAQDWSALQQRYARRTPVTVFYQVWSHPLMTVSAQQFIGDAIARCGGVNPFAHLPGLTPTIGVEDVLLARPQVLVTSTPDGQPDGSLQDWARWSALPAVARKQYLYLRADWLSRPTPRLLWGIRQLCEGIERTRQQSDH